MAKLLQANKQTNRQILSIYTEREVITRFLMHAVLSKNLPPF